MKPVYITHTARYLPGDPIDNDSMEAHLGLIDGQPSRLKKRILKANGIQTRHYAMNAAQQTTESNAHMAAKAAQACLDAAGMAKQKITLLCAATSQGDHVLPGFASMIQAELDIPSPEIHSAHGICSCSLMALKAGYHGIATGEHQHALVVVSELASRLFKHTRYEAVQGKRVDFDAEFLRWMLSDGAGAMLLSSEPLSAQSLRIDWIKGFSHADVYPTCMTVGEPSDQNDTRTWQDFPSYAEAEAAGALLIRQNTRLLDHMVKLGVEGALRLMRDGWFAPNDIHYFLCHYSSHHFKGRIVELLSMAGAMIDEAKWYSNLYTRGNTGAASIFIMLDEFLETHRLQNNDTILCMVPESGRFNTAYMHLTACNRSSEQAS